MTHRQEFLKVGIQAIELHFDDPLIIEIDQQIFEIKLAARSHQLAIHDTDITVKVLENDSHIPV